MSNFDISDRIHNPPFDVGMHGQIAVKVIADRGNELKVVKDLRGLK